MIKFVGESWNKCYEIDYEWNDKLNIFLPEK